MAMKIPTNAIAPTNDLLSFLDTAFQLGGKLIDVAQQRSPELKTTETGSADAVDKMQSARQNALDRVAEEAPQSEFPESKK